MTEADDWTVISRQKSKKKKYFKADCSGFNPTAASNVRATSSMDILTVNIFDSITAIEKPKKRKEGACQSNVTTEIKDAVMTELVERIIQALCLKSFVIELLSHLTSQIHRYIRSHPSAQEFNYDVVILGVGKFTESYNALLQLALSIHLFREITRLVVMTHDTVSCVETAEGTKVKVEAWIYDPVMTPEETRLCRDVLKLGVFMDNTAGKIQNRKGNRTLFYMPHCPYQLYCNVLWANWFDLEHVLIVGNSFESYELRRALTVTTATMASESIKKEGRNPNVIEHLLPLLVEIPLWAQTGKTASTKHLQTSSFDTEFEVSSSEHQLVTTSSMASLIQPFLKRINEKLTIVMKYFENAFCDTSLISLKTPEIGLDAVKAQKLLFGKSTDCTAGSQQSTTRLTEAEIDLLTANDVEVR